MGCAASSFSFSLPFSSNISARAFVDPLLRNALGPLVGGCSSSFSLLLSSHILNKAPVEPLRLYGRRGIVDASAVSGLALASAAAAAST